MSKSSHRHHFLVRAIETIGNLLAAFAFGLFLTAFVAEALQASDITGQSSALDRQSSTFFFYWLTIATLAFFIVGAGAVAGLIIGSVYQHRHRSARDGRHAAAAFGLIGATLLAATLGVATGALGAAGETSLISPPPYSAAGLPRTPVTRTPRPSIGDPTPAPTRAISGIPAGSALRLASAADGATMAELGPLGELRLTGLPGSDESRIRFSGTFRTDGPIALESSAGAVAALIGPDVQLLRLSGAGDWRRQSLSAEDVPIQALAIAPDAQYLAAAADRLYLWDAAGKYAVAQAIETAAGEPLTAIAFGPGDDLWLLVGDTMGNVFAWRTADIAAGPAKEYDLPGQINDIVWLADRRVFLIAAGSELYLVDPASKLLERIFTAPEPIVALDHSPIGNLAAAAAGPLLYTWKTNAFSAGPSILQVSDSISDIALRPAFAQAFVATEQGELIQLALPEE